jgi:four helix bundle protein
MYTREEKAAFIAKMKARTKKFAIDIIHFCDKLPKTQACRTISFQLIKSATSVGANYRAACRGQGQTRQNLSTYPKRIFSRYSSFKAALYLLLLMLFLSFN